MSSPASAPRRTLPLRTRGALWAGGTAAALSKAVGRGRGSVIGGKVALRLDPQALDHVARGRTLALVSGTNGKSTTARLLAEALRTMGPVALNDTGSNMEEGVLVALNRSPDARLGVLETDEAYLGPVSQATRPSAIVLINLSREYTRGVTMARTLRLWRDALGAVDWPCSVVANVDDPNVSWAAEAASDVLPVGAGLLWEQDAGVCRNCGHRLDWDGPQWSCPQCGRARMQPRFSLTADGVHGPEDLLPLDLRLPGAGTRSGAALALAAAAALGADVATAAEALRAVEGVDGRYLPYRIGPDHRMSMFLVKNPAGWAQMVDIAADASVPFVFAVEPFGVKDMATMWDAPVERLAGQRLVVSGQRRLDVANWLTTGGADVAVVPDPLEAVRSCPPGQVNVAVNYSSFKALRRRLAP